VVRFKAVCRLSTCTEKRTTKHAITDGLVGASRIQATVLLVCETWI